MSKVIEFGPEGRKKLVNGIDKLANAVVSTLGGYLKKIAELKTNTGEDYQSIREYLDEFTSVYNKIQETFKKEVNV